MLPIVTCIVVNACAVDLLPPTIQVFLVAVLNIRFLTVSSNFPFVIHLFAYNTQYTYNIHSDGEKKAHTPKRSLSAYRVTFKCLPFGLTMVQNIGMKITEKLTNFPCLKAILGQMVYNSFGVVSFVLCFFLARLLCVPSQNNQEFWFQQFSSLHTHFSDFVLLFFFGRLLLFHEKGYRIGL